MISIKNLTHIYKSKNEEVKALTNITLEINPGEWLAIIGANGSGKSTLARHLNALLLPTSGEVLVDGISTSDPSGVWVIREKVAMVFQNPDNQLVATTVEEDVAFGPENLGIPAEDIKTRVDWALRTVGMEQYREHAPHLLSGGQKQRVAIAGALAMRPLYLVFDEATAMLDPQGRQEVLATLRQLNSELGLTVIYITHFMEEVTHAHRVVALKNGEIAMTGTPREVFARARELHQLGLEVPEIAVLANKLVEERLIPQAGIISLDEMVELLCRYN